MPTPRWWRANGKIFEMISIYKNKNCFGGLFVWVLLAGLNVSCSSTAIKGEKTLKAKDLTLSYLDKSRAGQHVNALTLQHPVSLSKKEVFHHLVSLRFEGNALLSKQKPVFKKDGLQKIRRLLTRALNSVKPNHVVGFELDGSGGTTSDIVFASNGRLYWRFDEIRGAAYSLSGNQVTRYGTAWQLIPRKGQKLFVTKTLLGKKKWTNWIVAKLKLPGQPPKMKKGKGENRSQGNPQNFSPDTLEEKLSFLKRLHDKNLIDDGEYQQKRKDLLDQYLK